MPPLAADNPAQAGFFYALPGRLLSWTQERSGSRDNRPASTLSGSEAQGGAVDGVVLAAPMGNLERAQPVAQLDAALDRPAEL